MDEFLSDTTVHGVEFFRSESKKIRKIGIFVFIVAFCGIGFYICDIYIKWKVNPRWISQEVNLVRSNAYPFPAVTVCNSLFSRNQTPNINKVLQNGRSINLSDNEKEILAANIQACAPQIGQQISKLYPDIDPSNMVKVLKGKNIQTRDFFDHCSLRLFTYECDTLMNYVLTNFGFCFSYNMQGFNQILNSKAIASDFYSYYRTKIAKNYSEAYSESGIDFEVVNDHNDDGKWTLKNGYVNDDFDIQPTRANKVNRLSVFPKINQSDLNNLCPEQGTSFTILFHMPNEIPTPFHRPQYVELQKYKKFELTGKVFKVDESMRNYSPRRRECYYSDEKSLKFFKVYTKAQCNFECLSNQMLKKCGCVKFSMPRENSTLICGLNKTNCYKKIMENWSRLSPKCRCLNPCTYIEYEVQSSMIKMSFERKLIKARNE